MKGWLIDAYREKDKIVLWIKTPENDFFLEKKITCHIYLEENQRTKKILELNKLDYVLTKRKNLTEEKISVYKVRVPSNKHFEKFIQEIEHMLDYEENIYDADINPETLYLYKNKLTPFSPIVIGDEIFTVPGLPPVLSKCFIKIRGEKVIFNNKKYGLEEFCDAFQKKDSDVVYFENAFSELPKLDKRLREMNLKCNFHRWHNKPIRYKGGKSFYSYGRVIYRDYAIRLNGRLLVDTNSVVGYECEPDGIIELCQLSGSRFQQVASRSFGAVIQNAIVKEMYNRTILVPYKHKPLSEPMTMFEYIKADRGGHYYDPLIGYHDDIAEIDFSSMYPWLIYNYNISADTMLKKESPMYTSPTMKIRTSISKKGILPTAIKPFLDRKMMYNKDPSKVSRGQVLGLKAVLVTSYGYLRYREFKLGMPEAHMAICDYSRDILIKAAHLAESKGFKIIHGIVDSLYIQKKGITNKDVEDLCQEIYLMTGIPIANEGIFKWVIFLPSLNNVNRPVSTRYYGLFNNNSIKIRGIELRQKSPCFAIKSFQEEVLELLSKTNNEKEFRNTIPLLIKLLRSHIENLKYLSKDDLIQKVTISKTHYKNENVQQAILRKLKKKNIYPKPGQTIEYIHTNKGPELPDDYTGNIDEEKYTHLLVTSLYTLIAPFDITKDEIIEGTKSEIQTKLIQRNVIQIPN